MNYLPGKLYTHEQLSVATKDFAEANKLGGGGFGDVFSGTLDGVAIAVKRLNRDGNSLQGMKEWEKEVHVLGSQHHPHLLPLLGSCPSHGLLVYELMTGGSLEDRLSTKSHRPPIVWQDRVRICCEVAMALQHLHTCDPPIVHKDVKPSNVLLDDRLRAKLGDVGIAATLPQGSGGSTVVQTSMALRGTPHFMDPEYVRKGTYSTKSDTYALGVTMLQVLTGRTDVGVLEEAEEAVAAADGASPPGSPGRGTGPAPDLQTLVDPAAGRWPPDQALRFARLALRCCEMKRSVRPALDRAVLPELLEMSAAAAAARAEEAAVAEAILRAHSSSLYATPNGSVAASLAASVVAQSGAMQIPDFFVCPLSKAVMEDPVMAMDGYTYERSTIQKWLADRGTSPVTAARLENTALLPNHAVKAAIAEWRGSHKLGLEHQHGCEHEPKQQAQQKHGEQQVQQQQQQEHQKPQEDQHQAQRNPGEQQGQQQQQQEHQQRKEDQQQAQQPRSQDMSQEGSGHRSPTAEEQRRTGSTAPSSDVEVKMAALELHQAEHARAAVAPAPASQDEVGEAQATAGEQPLTAAALEQARRRQLEEAQEDLIAAGLAQLPRKYQCSSYASERKWAELLSALNQGLPWGGETCAAAAENGHLDVIWWARQHGCPWDPRTCAAAARNGHARTLRWAREKGCPWDSWTCAMAAAGGHTAILRWARACGCPWDEFTCEMAAGRGHLEALQWAHRKGCPLNAARCRHAATARGHSEVLEWLDDIGA